MRLVVRRGMRWVAGVLHSLSGGRLHPDVVTIIGLFMHAPIGWLIAVEHNMWAALLLVVFGLFDTLDGELARLQHRASNAGMLLDASTDRFKEVIIYCGVAYALIGSARPHAAVWAVAACGASLCVSYVKAKGELAVKDSGLSTSQINRLFQDGLLRFEVRMGLLVIGLVADRLLEATVLVAVMSSLTAIQRLVTISRKIS